MKYHIYLTNPEDVLSDSGISNGLSIFKADYDLSHMEEWIKLAEIEIDIESKVPNLLEEAVTALKLRRTELDAEYIVRSDNITAQINNLLALEHKPNG